MEPGGAIVFIGSVAGLQPGSRLPAYDASKAGLLGLCRHVALEAARRDVRANVVAPGLIDTPLGRIASARPAVARAHTGAARPAGHRLGGCVGDHVPAVAGASYVTGQVLAVDGGLTLILTASGIGRRSLPARALRRCVSSAGSRPRHRIPAAAFVGDLRPRAAAGVRVPRPARRHAAVAEDLTADTLPVGGRRG